MRGIVSASGVLRMAIVGIHYRAMPNLNDPIRLFVTHTWEENDDYTRVFEYLESPGTFYYKNTSLPHANRPVDPEAQREDLRRQIAPCEVVIVVPAADRPVVAMENFGSTAELPKAIKDLADEVSAWNERNLIDALRRQARHQETNRWDT